MESALQAGILEEYVLASSSIPDVISQEAFMIPLNKSDVRCSKPHGDEHGGTGIQSCL